MEKRTLYIYAGVAVGIILIIWGIVLYIDHKSEVDELTEDDKITDKDDPFGGILAGISAAIYGPEYGKTNKVQKYMMNSDLFKITALDRAEIPRDKDDLFREGADYLINEFNSTDIDEDGVFRSLENFADGDWGAFNLMYLNDLIYRISGKTLPDYFNQTTFGYPDFDVHDGARFYDIIQNANDSKSAKLLKQAGLTI